MSKIDDYVPIVGKQTVDDLFKIAKGLEGKIITNINSTAVGGGVAEILTRMVPLLRELGVDARWEVIKGDDRFFNITKKIHNALHGVDVALSEEEVDYFLEVDRENAENINLEGDVVLCTTHNLLHWLRKRLSLVTNGYGDATSIFHTQKSGSGISFAST